MVFTLCFTGGMFSFRTTCSYRHVSKISTRALDLMSEAKVPLASRSAVKIG